VGKPVGDDRTFDAGVGVLGRCGGTASVDKMGVVVGEGPHEDTDSAAANAVGHDPRILKRLPPQLQDESLLWIDGRRLSGGDTEKLGVELVDGVEKSTPWGRDRPNRGTTSGPAIGDGVTSLSQKPP
jgi:hypothetical protein